MSKDKGKTSLRILRFLNDTGTARSSIFNDGKSDRLLLTAASGKKVLTGPETLDLLHRADLVAINGQIVALTDLGQKKLIRASAVKDEYVAQHRTLASRTIKLGGADQEVSVNLDESPLTRLRTRKGPNGKTWLDDTHLEAGERLRRDFSIGRLMQKVTSSWDASAGSGKSGGFTGKADLTDNAIDARQRLYKALDQLGPDLSGVLTDVCCYLKGLESVERERRWPPRSAKLMLRTGLDLLSRHYGLVS